MPRTVQLRDISDEVYDALAARAAEAGMSVPQLLHREAARLAALPSIERWAERTTTRTADVTTDEVLETLDELRGGDSPTC